MPYKDIGAFRRAYRSEENSLAHKRSHNLIRDHQNLQRYRDELGRNSLPKTLESYQQIVYNRNDHDNLIHYVAARRSGTVSAVASFSDWQSMNTKLNTLFVGKTAANGVQIKSVSRHIGAMQSKFKITEEQKIQLKKFVPDIEEYLQKNLSELLHELNLVMSGELDENYEDTPNSIFLQKIYDELIEQND